MRGESLIGDGSQVSDRSQVSDELRLGDGSQVGDGWRRQLPNSVPIALLTKNVAIQRIVGSLLTIHAHVSGTAYETKYFPERIFNKSDFIVRGRW